MGEVVAADDSHVTSFLCNHGYTQDRTIGNGSYSNVRIAWSENLKMNIALKIVDKRKAKKDYLAKFFEREKEIIVQLRHPHIIHFLEVLNHGPLAVFVSEYAEGGDLLDLIRRQKRLSEDESRFLFRQLGEALNYLHVRNYVHRDVKCENILLDKSQNVKLGDFGFSRHFPNLEFSRTFCGSTAYAAPEITMGQPYTGCSVDLWSMGVVLYIMVTGLMPYDERNIRRMLEKQLEHKIGYAESVKNLVSEEVKYLISGLCHPQAHKRLRHVQILQSAWLRDTPWLIRSPGRILKVTAVPKNSADPNGPSCRGTG